MPSDLFRELLTLIKSDTITDKSAVEILRLILDAAKLGKNQSASGQSETAWYFQDPIGKLNCSDVRN